MVLVAIDAREQKGQAPGLAWVLEVVEGQPHAGTRATRYTGSIAEWRPDDHLDKLLVEMTGATVAPDEPYDFAALVHREFFANISSTGRVLKVAPIAK
jgi:hypothetical protein